MTPDILTAMLTPVVLISACASLLISTSNRLSRVVDETRSLSDRIETLTSAPQNTAEHENHQRKRILLMHQLPYMTRRARLLQSGLVILYAAVAIFVGTRAVVSMIDPVGADRRVCPGRTHRCAPTKPSLNDSDHRCSVALGVITRLQLNNLWIAISLGFIGMMLLLASSACLTLEARLALHTTAYEMKWLWEMLDHEG